MTHSKYIKDGSGYKIAQKLVVGSLESEQ